MRVFRKLLGWFTILVMAIGLIAIPNVSAKADETKGEFHYANGFSLDVDDLGNVKYIYAYVSTDATATVKTFLGQDIETLQWWYGYVLERNAAGNYVVTIADTDIYDGVNAAETAPLGEGKIAIVFHRNTAKKHQASMDFFKLLKEGDEVALNCKWDDLAAANGILTKPAAFTEVPIGKVHFVNANARETDYTGRDKNIYVYASADNTATPKTFTGRDGYMKLWYGYVLERNTAGNYVVTSVDGNLTDGINVAEGTTLGKGRILILFHEDVRAYHNTSLEFFTSLQEGDILALDCSWEDLAAVRGSLVTPATFSMVYRAVEASNDGSDITDDDTVDDNITSNDTIDDGTSDDAAGDDTTDDDTAGDDITEDDTTGDTTIGGDMAGDDTTDVDIADDDTTDDDTADDDTTDDDTTDSDTTDKGIEDTSNNLVLAMVVLFICVALVTVVIVIRKRV